MDYFLTKTNNSNIDGIVLGQFAHRVGYTLKNGFCDGCYHHFEDGEMGFRCLECSGVVFPRSNERTVRQIVLTTNVKLQSGTTQLNLSQTEPLIGYDLCLECAKQSFLHSHHHFTL
ncbi:unnamed protein product [Rotaria magnacalcarata]|uniref:Uncharacterized protein n=1 Tax=Rotaria magnacalcarata TaxID=392030 RepID=A0A820HMQ0_9BILA|nr:unnamed protein product [Rotaria magnacalcarata]CAF4294615.1 unnamed protein product [Rotaria magnacalcarata]